MTKITTEDLDAQDAKWKGETKIVVGIDIGATQSGVSFAYLEKGTTLDKALNTVTRWPGQEVGLAKIPTAIWYNTSGEAESFGAETTLPGTEEKAEDGKWFLAKHFKLLLHPEELRIHDNIKTDAQLSYGVTLEQVYTDFLRYLFKYTKEYFEYHMVPGDEIWLRHRDRMEFVIAHPNAWRTREQTFLRNVAVRAGLVNDGQASSHIRFVTEAEASAQFCLQHSHLRDDLQVGSTFAVCDAGGSTVDTTVYSVISVLPAFTISETHASGCVQAGGIYIDEAARSHIQSALRGAGVAIGEEDLLDYLKVGTQSFEERVKRAFRNDANDYSIKLGGKSLDAPSASVRRGSMVLSSTAIRSFFEVSIQRILENVDNQLKDTDVSRMLLVGGFGDNVYLRDRLKERYKGCQIILTKVSTAKAVADGAVIWSYNQLVTSRAPRSSFGTTVHKIRDTGNPEHSGRDFYVGKDGEDQINGVWYPIVMKGVPLHFRSVHRRSLCRLYKTPTPSLRNYFDTIDAYSGMNAPYWSKDTNGLDLNALNFPLRNSLKQLSGVFNPGFRSDCHVTANFQGMVGALERKVGKNDTVYWRLSYDLCIRFGGVELEAFIEWVENGITQRGPATIIPDQP